MKNNHLLIGFICLCAAIILAFLSQYLLTPLGKVVAGYLTYGVASLFALIGVIKIDKYVPLPEQISSDKNIQKKHIRAFIIFGSILLIIGIAVSVVSYYIQEKQLYSPAFWWWIFALLITAIGGWALDYRPNKSNFSELIKKNRHEIILLLLLVFGAALLRIPNLYDIPPHIEGDETGAAVAARQILTGEEKNLFSEGIWNEPNITFGIISIFMRIFGDDFFGFRIASAIQGVVSVLLLYFIAKELFSKRIAAISAFLLAISQWHIHFSRLGIENLQASFAGLLFFFFLLRGIQRKSFLNCILAGFAIGLCLNVYLVARLMPVIAFLYILFKMFTERNFLRANILYLLAIGIGTLVFLMPMASMFLHGALYARTNRFIINPRNWEGMPVDALIPFLKSQALLTVGAFNFGGESSWLYRRGGPLLDFWSGALFVLGVIIVTFRIFRARYFFVATWFWLTLLIGSVLTVSDRALFSPHVITTVPVLFIFPAIVIDAMWRAASTLFRKRGRYISAVLTILFLILAARANYEDYFHTHINKDMPGHFYSTIGRYLDLIQERYRVYYVGENIQWHSTLTFFVRDAVYTGEQVPRLPLDQIPRKKGVAFIIPTGTNETDEKLAALRQVYPRGNQTIQSNRAGYQFFYSYLVEHEELLAANPNATMDVKLIPGVGIADANAFMASNETKLVLPRWHP